MSTTYQQFLEQKRVSAQPVGFEDDISQLNPSLFPFQRDIVQWALKLGRAAVFADCGLGKSLMQLEWANQVCFRTGGNVLILAPLAVAQQTKREGDKFGIPVTICKTQADVRPGVNITNYQKLHHFDASQFVGVVLDESSILKSLDGKTRTKLIEMFAQTPYRLACTATPAPNDHMELGNHAEFLGVMSRTEMLSMFFVHDGGKTADWRLKGHAQDDFWKWVCTWGVLVRRPSDLGYGDEGFELPPLKIIDVQVEGYGIQEGHLFPVAAETLMERRAARRNSIEGRVEEAARVVGQDNEIWCLWCDLNDEGNALAKAIPGAVQISGSDTDEHKEQSMLDFAAGKIRVLVAKPSMFGHGMNLQICHNTIFVGRTDSYEIPYQAIRRFWRHGQEHTVRVFVITSDAESNTAENIRRKEADAAKMAEGMVAHLRETGLQSVGALSSHVQLHERVTECGQNWVAHRGDAVEIVAEMESNSIDYSIYSPPFSSLYTYSNSERDMGNCKGDDEFFGHFAFLARDLYRVLKPGRLMSVHCMNLPTSKERDGVIGLRDFRGDLIRLFQSVGFIYHSEVCIWKDPVTAMQRTKALGLLHKTIRKDSAMARQGIPDYLVTMRKPGENAEPIPHTHENFPIPLWQQYASPVWMDINQSDTLQRESAREEKDERHICCLQKKVIQRGIELWTNPGDLVLSPFGGIGSEGYVAIEMGRRAVLCELKMSYFKQLCANLRRAEVRQQQGNLFDDVCLQNQEAELETVA